MIVSLFAGMLALYTTAGLTRRELLKTCRRDTVQFRVLPPVGDHFVRVRANEVALEAMEVGRLVLHRAQRGRVRALRPPTRHVGPVLLEIATHQGVEPLVSRRVLDETSFVAERVATVLTHAVEMRLVFPVTAVGIPAVLVESEPNVSFRHRFVLEHPHGVMKPLLLRLWRIAVGRGQGSLVQVEIGRERGQWVLVSCGR